MRETVFDDFGRIRRCGNFWESDLLALKCDRFAHSGSAADNFTETRRVRSKREATKMLPTFRPSKFPYRQAKPVLALRLISKLRTF